MDEKTSVYIQFRIYTSKKRKIVTSKIQATQALWCIPSRYKKLYIYLNKNRRTIKNGSFHRPYTYAFAIWHKETTKICFSTARKKSKYSFRIGSWRVLKFKHINFQQKPMNHIRYVLIFTYSRPHCCFNNYMSQHFSSIWI